MNRRGWSMVVGLLSLLMAGVFAVSCVAPQAEVRQVELQRLTWETLDIGLLLNLHNPNDIEMPLDQVDWNLNLFESAMARGVVRPQARIPAKGREQVRVPISVAITELVGAAEALVRSDRIPWDVGGTCHFGTAAGPITVDFSRSGTWTNPLR